MLVKSLAFLAVASLAKDAVAVNIHRHGHEHMHEKKDLKLETDYTTVTEWVTVTAFDPPAPTTNVQFVAATHSKSRSHTRKYSKQSSSVESSSTSTSTEIESTPAPTTVAAPETTLATQVKPVTSEDSPAPAAPAPVTEAPAPAAPEPTTPAAVQPEPTVVAAAAPAAAPPAASGGKRGLAYNDPILLAGFAGTGSKVSWAYNWGQTNDQMGTNLEFVPMLWGPGHADSWNSNAEKALAAGSTHLLSFNEPDNAGQANIDPATAAAAHIQYMNPFAGRARIGSPAITNSGGDGQGISWLQGFMSACAGQCKVDFVVMHWYSNNGKDFLSQVKRVHDAVGLPVWVTEFAPVGNEVNYNDFIQDAVHQLDTNPDFSYVERYSYFMVSDGSLVSGTQPSQLGHTFAYAS